MIKKSKKDIFRDARFLEQYISKKPRRFFSNTAKVKTTVYKLHVLEHGRIF